MDKVFEAFYTTKENGLGMGLAICRSIVEAHHHRLWAESAFGDGRNVLLHPPHPANNER
jgi:signal transduction histidine kinase